MCVRELLFVQMISRPFDNSDATLGNGSGFRLSAIGAMLINYLVAAKAGANLLD